MYTVIAPFRDAMDGGHIYHPGDAFPRDGVAVSPARIEELAGDTNKTGRALIRATGEQRPAKGRRRRKNA